ncbi:MAG: hypothetical protein KDD94_10250 [Calditrichaeota bacterium]|nr:hypothetical protein [Calditrichota bacterium]
MIVEIGYYGLSLFMIGLFPVILRKADTDLLIIKRLTRIYFIWIISWLIYVTILSVSGILITLDLPPRMPLLIVLPALISIYFYTRMTDFKNILTHLHLSIPVLVQSFRIFVELLIFGTFTIGILPQRVTFEGINFDILVGITAIIIAYFIYKRKLTKPVVIVWNILSLCILSVTVFAFISSFYFLDLVDTQQLEQFLSMPFILLPAVLLPFAIFYHLLSIKQNLQP